MARIFLPLALSLPGISDQPLRPKYANFPWLNDPDNLRRWQFGKTGYPMVDAGMRQLYETGWMHNRVRMIVASFLVKHLLLPWQEGARWFWDTLVDAISPATPRAGNGPLGVGRMLLPTSVFLIRLRREINLMPGVNMPSDGFQSWKKCPRNLFSVHGWLPHPCSLRVRWNWTIDYPGPCVDHSEARARALAALATLKQI